MAVTMVDLEITTAGLGIDIYDKLNSLGLVDQVIGTTTWSNFVFSSPLLANGYYFRIKWNTSYSAQVSMGLEIGTVSGTTFTVVKTVLATAVNQTGNVRSGLKLFYDSTLKWIFLLEYIAPDSSKRSHGFYIGQFDNGERICFGLAYASAKAAGIISLENPATAVTGLIWTFPRPISLNGNYLEQPLRATLADALVMNGTSAACVLGLSNVAIAFSEAVVLSSNWALVGGIYVSAVDVLPTYLKFDLV
ncbi:hypothetical protein DSECCO2_530670 [anaerobic digester metagenome]